MTKIKLILTLLILTVSFQTFSLGQTRKTQSKKGTVGITAPKKPTVAPTKQIQVRQTNSSVGGVYQTLAGGFAGVWGPWMSHYGYSGIQMRARLMKDMQPKGQPWYNWEIQIKNNYQDTINASPFTGDKNKFKNPLINELYSDGAIVTVAPGKINSSSGYRGTKTDVKIYLNLIFKNSPKFDFPGGEKASKIALHDNGSLPEYCRAYNERLCPNFKEEEKAEEEIETLEAKKEEKPKEDSNKKAETTADEVKQKIVELIKSHSGLNHFDYGVGRDLSITGDSKFLKIRWVGSYDTVAEFIMPWEYFFELNPQDKTMLFNLLIERRECMSGYFGAKCGYYFKDGTAQNTGEWYIPIIRTDQWKKNSEFSQKAEVLFKQLGQLMNKM